MGLNLSGLAIGHKFNNNIDELSKYLDIELEYIEETTVEEASYHKDDNVFDVIFSDKGVLILNNEPFMFDHRLSNGKHDACSFGISETAMVFGLNVWKNGQQIREFMEAEGEIHANEGDLLPNEDLNDDQSEHILKGVETIFGHFIIFGDDDCFEMPGKRYILKQTTIDSPKTQTSNYIEPNIVDSYKAPFYDAKTRASNPGNTKIDFVQYATMNFSSFVKNLAILGLGYYALGIHWIFYIPFIFIILRIVWLIFNVRSKFAAGDVNPGLVVSINPDIVAVHTNMTKGFGNFPIVKLFETRLPKQDKEVNKIIVTTALYNDNPYDYPFWAEFHPVPFSHGTKDQAAIQYKLSTFSENDIIQLNNHVALLNTKTPGTYKVDISTSGWKDYPDVEIGSINNMKDPKK